MRAAVRSVSARSVSGLRAGSALTIGVGGNELSKAIALLRSVGGRMYLPGLTSRVASDGSGGSPVAGDVIGWLPDRVSGANAATRSTTGSKPKLIREPILGPELVVHGGFDRPTSWVLNNGATVSGGVLTLPQTGSAVQGLPLATLGNKYAVTITTDAGSTGNVFLNAYIGSAPAYVVFTHTAVAQKTVTITATTSKTLIIQQDPNAAGTTKITSVSVREILGYTERYSLEFDGVDDYIAAPSTATLSDGLVMVWAGKQLSTAVGKRLLAGWDTTTLNEFGIGTTATGVDVRLRVSGYSELGTLSLPTSIGSATVITIKLTATNVSVRFNGGAWSNVEHGRVLPNTVLGLGLGARTNGGLQANCSMSAGIVANLGASATDANIAILERAAAQAAGITL